MTVLVLNDVEVWFPKLNPKRPNGRFNPKNPTWEMQGRTLSVDTAREEAVAEAISKGESQEAAELLGEKAAAAARVAAKDQKKHWESNNLRVKAIVPDEGETYYRINLRKKSLKEDGEPSSFVKVVDGDLNPVDPDTIGNGSVANVRIFQYEYTGTDGKPGVASVLMGIQLTKHIIYTPTLSDDFEKTTTKVVGEVKESDADEAEGDDFKKAESPSPVIPGGKDDY